MAFKKFILIQQTENPRHSSDALPRSLRRQWTQELTTLPRLWQCQPLRRTAPMPHLQPRLAQTVDKQDTAPLHLDKLRSLPPIIMLHRKTSHLPGLAATAAVLIPLHWMPRGPQEPGVTVWIKDYHKSLSFCLFLLKSLVTLMARLTVTLSADNQLLPQGCSCLVSSLVSETPRVLVLEKDRQVGFVHRFHTEQVQRWLSTKK